MGKAAGAGLIPFCVRQGGAHFLFHRTFSGRRAGLLVDFGGGRDPGESLWQAAIREFIEETEGLYFAADHELSEVNRNILPRQLPLVDRCLSRSREQHPQWCCRRYAKDRRQFRDWRTWVVQIPYRDPAPLNQQWATDNGQRFVKRRELLWIEAPELLKKLEHPDLFWKRVGQLQGLAAVVAEVMATDLVALDGRRQPSE